MELPDIDLGREWESQFAVSVRDTLEDFECIGDRSDVILIPRHSWSFQALRTNVGAAAVASMLGLASIDYAKRKYCGDEYVERLTPKRDKNQILREKYISAYKSAKKHIQDSISRLSTEGKPPPSNGVFGASLVLERLPSSIFCAHLLYSLGHKYEGHAISRLMLEQIAWANEAYRLDSLSDIERIQATKAVSGLKKIVPSSGILYGYLTGNVHVNFEKHGEFLRVADGKIYVLGAQPEYLEFARVLLYLADLFAIVWELSQFSYLSKVECIRIKNGALSVREDRQFLKTIRQHVRKMEAVARKARQSTSGKAV